MDERVGSGIPGLDRLISGGFVKGSTILVSGGTGAGKTTFCVQFLLDGLKNGEGGVYVSMEESPKEIKKDMKTFGWDLESYEKSGKLRMIYQNPFEISDISSTLNESIKATGAKRVVIDPISLMGLYMKEKAAMRKKLFQLTEMVREADVTTLMTSEILEDSKGLSRGGLAEFVVDGVIVLYYMKIGSECFGNIEIRKMRRTPHKHGLFPVDITRKGLNVKSNESVARIR